VIQSLNLSKRGEQYNEIILSANNGIADNTGHHHLLIDVDTLPPVMSQKITITTELA